VYVDIYIHPYRSIVSIGLIAPVAVVVRCSLLSAHCHKNKRQTLLISVWQSSAKPSTD